MFMSSLFIKPIVQHHRSRVSPVQPRDFPLHQWGNLTVKDPAQHLHSVSCSTMQLNVQRFPSCATLRMLDAFRRFFVKFLHTYVHISHRDMDLLISLATGRPVRAVEQFVATGTASGWDMTKGYLFPTISPG